MSDSRFRLLYQSSPPDKMGWQVYYWSDLGKWLPVMEFPFETEAKAIHYRDEWAAWLDSLPEDLSYLRNWLPVQLKAIEPARMTPAVEDFDTIGHRMRWLRLMADRKCATKNGGQVIDCWCYLAGPEGRSIPCSEAADNLTPSTV